MTEGIYRQKMKELKELFESKQKALDKKFAMVNNTYKVGDNVGSTRSNRGLVIDDILFGFDPNTNLPTCIYFGIVLNEDGEPSKSGERNCISQNYSKKWKEY